MTIAPRHDPPRFHPLDPRRRPIAPVPAAPPADRLVSTAWAAGDRRAAALLETAPRMATVERPQHIVVMDEAEEIRGLLRELLEAEGYRVSTTGSLLSPVELKALAPDLLLLDVTFHGQGVGWSLVAALRNDDGLRDVPVVLCTGASQAVRERAATLAEAKVGVVLKPFDVDSLLDEIARRLGDRR